MTYIPRIIAERAQYEAEKACVTSIDEYNRFQGKWFADEPWPEKSPEQRDRDAEEVRRNLRALGWWQRRKWFVTPSNEDVPPEALYERDVVGFEMAWPLRFGRDAWRPPESPAGMWTKRCAASGIGTADMGTGDLCPLCGRRLIYIWAASDEG